jgi:hypothetical protein
MRKACSGWATQAGKNSSPTGHKRKPGGAVDRLLVKAFGHAAAGLAVAANAVFGAGHREVALPEMTVAVFFENVLAPIFYAEARNSQAAL